MQVSRAILRGAMFRRAAAAGTASTFLFGSTAATAATGTTATTSPMVCGPAMRVQARFQTAPAKNANPYKTLNIKEGATKDEIKKAYRVMARKHHPDAPGGNHEKFQEIQEAYEAIKSGVWIKRGGESGESGGEGGGGGGASGNRYSGFRYKTRTHSKNKVSYDQFYTEMHTGRVKKDPFADDEEDEDPEAEAARKDPRRNPFAMNELAFQAWLRFIIMWCLVFTSFRLTLFLIFPPKWEKPKRKPPPRELRNKPPPPKALAQTSDSLVS